MILKIEKRYDRYKSSLLQNMASVTMLERCYPIFGTAYKLL